MPRGLQFLLWSRFSWRHARRAPGSTFLLVLILALGVAVYLAIRLANRAAVSGFQNFTDVLTAESDGLVVAPAGSLPESVLDELRTALGPRPVHLVPVLESTGARPSAPGQSGTIGARDTFQILGVDLIAVRNLPAARMPTGTADRPGPGPGPGPSPGPAAGTGSVPAGSGPEAFWERFRDPHAVFATEGLARRERLAPGDRLPLVVNETVVPLRIAGILPSDPTRPEPPESLLVMDLPALQRLTGRTGRLDRVEFVLPEAPDRPKRWVALKEELERLSGGRWIVGTPADRRDAASMMTRAFRLNLTVLSLLALLVGLYLVVQALDGAVVRRREEIAVLRALGVEAGRIRRAWLTEAAVLGAAGGGLGILLGWAGAQAAVRGVGQTVNALYHATSVRAASLEPVEAGVAMGLALVASVAAGWWPARAAAEVPPAQLLGRSRASLPVAASKASLPVALALAAAGCVLSLLPPVRFAGGSRLSLAAFVAALAWLLAAGLLAGRVLPVVARLLGPAGGASATFRLALGPLRRPTGRHRLAVAGLACAVAMTGGMAILVGSFDTTMRGWIERTFMADLYVSSDGAQSASSQNRLAPATWREIVADPDVADVNLVQVQEVVLPGGSTLLVGGSPGFMRRHARIAWREEPLDDALFDPARNEGLAIASESFSRRFEVRRGDRLRIPTPAGPRELRLVGVFSDYGNERGSLVVQRESMARWFDDEQATSVIVKLRAGADPEAVRARWLSGRPGLAVFTNPHLRSEALRIFRQTFAITHALELIGLAVSVAGLAATLASLLWERRPDLTVLRALGLRHRELAWATAIEATLTALAGVLVGIASSLLLGWLLIHRVNVQTFGWTLETDLPVRGLATLAGLVLVMAAVTGWIVGRWGSALPAEREE